MKRDNVHLSTRNKVEFLLIRGKDIEKISKILNLPLGTRFQKGSAKWYRYCIKAKENQKKAIEKHPNLYSKAGKIAQQKHPWIGVELGKKFGRIAGRLRMEQIKKQGDVRGYFSKMAKRLQQINPSHSKQNMRKAHETMKRLGKFNEHQRLAALKCREKYPSQLKKMSNKAHKLYPLALLALESHRKNYPYEFMGCFFDSDQERFLCKKLIEAKLIEKPIEKENVHFRIRKCHIDFFIQNRIFLEFHPPIIFGGKNETKENYYESRRKLLNNNGFKGFPLIIISHINEIHSKIEQLKSMIRSL